MKCSFPFSAIIAIFFLLVISYSSNAQFIITKNNKTNSAKSVENILNENHSTFSSVSTIQANATTYTNKINAEGLHFTENKGQIADLKGNLRTDILFTAHNGGAKLFLTANGISYQFSRQFIKNESTKDRQPFSAKFKHTDVDSTQFYRLDVKLIGANPHPEIIKQGEGSGIENYYLAHCPNGILGVKNYNKIIYKDVYQHIDWVVYSKGKTMEYDFIVNPGGKVSDIKLQYDGAEKVSLDEKGVVQIDTRLGSVSEQKPISYQQEGREVESRFTLEENIISFDIKEYDKSKLLTIDPTIVWSTYYGGEGEDNGASCTVDKNGNVYFAGDTHDNGSDIAFNGFQSIYGGGNRDAFLVKFDAAGNRLWGTYYGGNDDERGEACSLDNNGNVYLAGSTKSNDDIAQSGFQNSINGDYDAFLVKFDSSGNRLWGTYYGGNAYDESWSCAVDKNNNAYITGYTESSSNIAFNGFQNSYNGSGDAFLVKFDAAGNRLWGTYYGGEGNDVSLSCAVDATNNVYLSGGTKSISNIASGGFQNSYNGNGDAFLVKFNTSGSRIWATYYGGNKYDDGSSCTADSIGNVYISGYTESNSNIASNGFQNNYGGQGDGFLIKFTSSGNRLWATYYGGTKYDDADFCINDASGNIYLVGYAESTSGIASGGFQNNYSGGGDAFLAKFDSSCNRIWSSYFGGKGEDDGFSCAVNNNEIYLAGYTGSKSGIASGGFQNNYGGAFIAKIADDVLPLHLLSFSATLQNRIVSLHWQTVQEINTDYFIIEKSKDGITYSSVQQVTAIGNSNAHNYTATDNNPFTGTSIYRLKMVDKDGAFTYSNAVPVSYIIKNLITVSPNPTTDKLTVQLHSVTNGKASLQITGVNGTILYRKQLVLSSGINTVPVVVSKFTKGTYLLTVVQGDSKQTLKWVKE